jgi:hypothetical protein
MWQQEFRVFMTALTCSRIDFGERNITESALMHPGVRCHQRVGSHE